MNHKISPNALSHSLVQPTTLNKYMLTKELLDLDLTSVDGNAFMLMGAFKKAARNQGWGIEDINKVLKEAQVGDYDNLVGVLFSYCK